MNSDCSILVVPTLLYHHVSCIHKIDSFCARDSTEHVEYISIFLSLQTLTGMCLYVWNIKSLPLVHILLLWYEIFLLFSYLKYISTVDCNLSNGFLWLNNEKCEISVYSDNCDGVGSGGGGNSSTKFQYSGECEFAFTLVCHSLYIFRYFSVIKWLEMRMNGATLTTAAAAAAAIATDISTIHSRKKQHILYIKCKVTPFALNNRHPKTKCNRSFLFGLLLILLFLLLLLKRFFSLFLKQIQSATVFTQSIFFLLNLTVVYV